MFDPNFQGFSVFVDVDENGEIDTALIGQNVIADRQYHFFFLVEESIASNINQYKVIINQLIPQLVLK